MKVWVLTGDKRCRSVHYKLIECNLHIHLYVQVYTNVVCLFATILYRYMTLYIWLFAWCCIGGACWCMLLFYHYASACVFLVQETAINIGFSSRLLNENMDLIKINASSLVRTVHTLPNNVSCVHMYMHMGVCACQP